MTHPSPNELIRLAAEEIYKHLEPEGFAPWPMICATADAGDVESMATEAKYMRAARKALAVYKTHRAIVLPGQ